MKMNCILSTDFTLYREVDYELVPGERAVQPALRRPQLAVEEDGLKRGICHSNGRIEPRDNNLIRAS